MSGPATCMRQSIDSCFSSVNFHRLLSACRDLKATELRILRVMVSGLYDYLGVIARTLREFGVSSSEAEAGAPSAR